MEEESDYMHEHILLCRFLLDDGHERSQQRKEIDGAQVVIGFYKYTGNVLS